MLVAPLALMLVTSCSDNYTVEGTVSCDGKPVPDGYIAFELDGGGNKGAGGTITDGSYRFKALPGKYVVRIFGNRTVGIDNETQQYLPERYNDKTELTAEVPVSGSLDFELKSK